MDRQRRRENPSGFTLVKVMIVVAVLGRRAAGA
jgi:Tfp pilus assembly protein PilE